MNRQLIIHRARPGIRGGRCVPVILEGRREGLVDLRVVQNVLPAFFEPALRRGHLDLSRVLRQSILLDHDVVGDEDLCDILLWFARSLRSIHGDQVSMITNVKERLQGTLKSTEVLGTGLDVDSIAPNTLALFLGLAEISTAARCRAIAVGMHEFFRKFIIEWGPTESPEALPYWGLGIYLSDLPEAEKVDSIRRMCQYTGLLHMQRYRRETPLLHHFWRFVDDALSLDPGRLLWTDRGRGRFRGLRRPRLALPPFGRRALTPLGMSSDLMIRDDLAILPIGRPTLHRAGYSENALAHTALEHARIDKELDHHDNRLENLEDAVGMLQASQLGYESDSSSYGPYFDPDPFGL